MNLWLRITIGVTIFAVLAITDLRRNGRSARRWREYSFLLAVTVAAMAYGAINDQITSRISWEYFFYGKELDKILGPATPPDPSALHWQAMKVGIQATWSAGRIIGVALLLANNPSRRFPRLSEPRLFLALLIVFAITVPSAALGGVLGYHGRLNWMSSEFSSLEETNTFRPHRFLCTYGIHLGGYIGGALGIMPAVLWVRRRRASAIQSSR